ncbi:hypothetical protein HIM_08766 [Hirsutella minnesotensis 3608]|uniref:Uncharacterized protein n=1 Tax=Hirsutella minnesotensis 3608 TaxID=1043627 RepID=A0A0F7ZSR8_9HYPO|nr:hypothetical protein HIM_08766 [Hirsutella minnesotensis 3608]
MVDAGFGAPLTSSKVLAHKGIDQDHWSVLLKKASRFIVDKQPRLLAVSPNDVLAQQGKNAIESVFLLRHGAAMDKTVNTLRELGANVDDVGVVLDTAMPTSNIPVKGINWSKIQQQALRDNVFRDNLIQHLHGEGSSVKIENIEQASDAIRTFRARVVDEGHTSNMKELHASLCSATMTKRDGLCSNMELFNKPTPLNEEDFAQLSNKMQETEFESLAKQFKVSDKTTRYTKDSVAKLYRRLKVKIGVYLKRPVRMLVTAASGLLQVLNIGSWVAEVQQVFSDPDSTSGERWAAVTSVVPIFGCMTSTGQALEAGSTNWAAALDGALCTAGDAATITGVAIPLGIFLHVSRLFIKDLEHFDFNALYERRNKAFEATLEDWKGFIQSTRFESRVEDAAMVQTLPIFTVAAESRGNLTALMELLPALTSNDSELSTKTDEAYAAYRTVGESMCNSIEEEFKNIAREMTSSLLEEINKFNRVFISAYLTASRQRSWFENGKYLVWLAWAARAKLDAMATPELNAFALANSHRPPRQLTEPLEKMALTRATTVLNRLYARSPCSAPEKRQEELDSKLARDMVIYENQARTDAGNQEYDVLDDYVPNGSRKKNWAIMAWRSEYPGTVNVATGRAANNSRIWVMNETLPDDYEKEVEFWAYDRPSERSHGLVRVPRVYSSDGPTSHQIFAYESEESYPADSPAWIKFYPPLVDMYDGKDLYETGRRRNQTRRWGWESQMGLARDACLFSLASEAVNRCPRSV